MEHVFNYSPLMRPEVVQPGDTSAPPGWLLRVVRDQRVAFLAVGMINPVVGFAVITAAAVLFGFFAAGRVIRRVDAEGMPAVARLLVVFTVATIAAQVAFALGSSFTFVMVVFLAAILARSLLAPLYTTWLNRQVTDSSVRATVLSISGQANAVGQATGGPVLGVVGNTFGIPAAIVAWLQALNISAWMFLLTINVILLVVGCFLDPLSAILLLTPLLVPLVKAFGIDTVHFGIVVTVNLAIGLFHPPFGMNIFVANPCSGSNCARSIAASFRFW